MRVIVAAEAVLEFVMGLPRFQMALAALRDGFLNCRRMTDVTAHTRYVPVLPPGSCYVSWRGCVALHAIVFCQRRFGQSSRSARIRQEHPYPRYQGHDDYKDTAFECSHLFLLLSILEPFFYWPICQGTSIY